MRVASRGIGKEWKSKVELRAVLSEFTSEKKPNYIQQKLIVLKIKLNRAIFRPQLFYKLNVTEKQLN